MEYPRHVKKRVEPRVCTDCFYCRIRVDTKGMTPLRWTRTGGYVPMARCSLGVFGERALSDLDGEKFMHDKTTGLMYHPATTCEDFDSMVDGE